MRRMIGVLISMVMLFGLVMVSAASAVEKYTVPDPGEWNLRMKQAPHASSMYNGNEYEKRKWPIIGLAMAERANIPYPKVQGMTGFLQMVAPESDLWPGPLGLIDERFAFPGYAYFDYKSGDEDSAGLHVSQYVWGMPFKGLGSFGDRFLVQFEPEFSLPLHPNQKGGLEAELMYGYMTYFPETSDRFTLSAGRMLPDLYSHVRHPRWMNPSQTMPWTTGLVPMSTTGGKIGFNFPYSETLKITGSFFGGTEVKNPSWLESSGMVGGRIGMHLPKKAFEAGMTFVSVNTDEDTDNVFGGYAVKKFGTGDAKIHGEFQNNPNKGFAWWTEGVLPAKYIPGDMMKNSFFRNLSFIARYQQFISYADAEDCDLSGHGGAGHEEHGEEANHHGEEAVAPEEHHSDGGHNDAEEHHVEVPPAHGEPGHYHPERGESPPEPAPEPEHHVIPAHGESGHFHPERGESPPVVMESGHHNAEMSSMHEEHGEEGHHDGAGEAEEHGMDDLDMMMPAIMTGHSDGCHSGHGGHGGGHGHAGHGSVPEGDASEIYLGTEYNLTSFLMKQTDEGRYRAKIQIGHSFGFDAASTTLMALVVQW